MKLQGGVVKEIRTDQDVPISDKEEAIATATAYWRKILCAPFSQAVQQAEAVNHTPPGMEAGQWPASHMMVPTRGDADYSEVTVESFGAQFEENPFHLITETMVRKALEEQPVDRGMGPDLFNVSAVRPTLTDPHLRKDLDGFSLAD